MSIELKAKKSKNIKNISLSVLAISIIVISGWLFNIRPILTVIPGVPPMEFSTALSFFLSSLGVLAAQRKSTLFLILNRATISGVLIIALVTIGQYFFDFNFSIDTLFINNTYATAFPGKMSLAAAICFFLLGISIWGMYSKSEKINAIIELVFLAIILVNAAAVIIFILNIIGNDAGFLLLIPIHSSLILFWFSSILSHKNADKAFNDLLFSNYIGSKLMRTSGHFVFTLIMVQGLVLLYLINYDIVDVNAGIIVYSIVAIFLSMSNIFTVAIRLNNAEQEKVKYENALHASIQETKQYKEALDASSLVDITDANGTIISVNDKFCETSNYERNELIGKTHQIINSGHHSKEFFTDLWGQIKKGEIWA
ncbi:PAS domain S-box protein [Kriegella aquimaris]|uniref:PAS domain S-box-containing protein n=1 Tax=Kriegella aquimaris TaxID=192904 RepID=A0A1G9TVJ0_9FLAO|nr:PAS domain S-box protein [Kriegella aquimaris]SDM51672.1 PAS domain S-box-containing protein [Kriegella aquimaris]